MNKELKMIYAILIVLILWAGSSHGQPAPPLSPMQGGEDVATAFVLSGPLPINATGTTDGFIDDYDEECPYSESMAPDVVYAYTPSSAVTVDIDLCGSSYDTKVYIYENTVTPGAPFDCNDDFYFDAGCGIYVSKIEGAVLAGGNTYYIVIDGSTDFDYGEYILTISEVILPPSCVWGVDVICPEGAAPEGETCGEDDNGGCDMAFGTETWETVPSSGGAFCGTTWADAGDRDTDWFELVLTGASSVILTADADQEIFYGLVVTDIPGAPTCETLTGSVIPGSNAGPCNETFLDLETLGPGTYWFVVRMNVIEGFPCDNHYWIDFDVTPLPCVPPEELSAQNITPTSADLGWAENGDATAWEYQYGPAGFIPAETGTATTNNPVPVNGLSADTGYDFYVRADCGDGLYSEWSGPENFHTPCNPSATIPWSENFDTMAVTGNNILPDCWAAESFTGTPWSSGNAASMAYNDPCSSPNYVFVYYSPYPQDKFLITPGFTLTSGTSYDFGFNWSGDGNAGWTSDVLINTSQTGAGATVIGSPFVESGTLTSATCTPVTRSFVPDATGTYYFMIRVNNTVSPYYLGFDDFSLDYTPACIAPSGLAAGSITTTSANLSWTPGGSETAWEYVYGESPLPVPAGSGISSNSNTVNPLAGLSANTDYQFYVRAVCGEEFSDWSGPGSFSTLCDAVSTFPWTEGFETAWPPECWTDADTEDYDWDRSVFGSAHSGTEWAYCNLEGSQLVTPAFDLADDSRLVFWFRVEDADYPQDMAVKIGNEVIFQISGAANIDYQQVGVSLAGFTGQTISITFVGGSGAGGVDFGICLDELTVRSETNYWTGNISSAWDDPGNWSGGYVPDQVDSAVIPSIPPGAIFPVIASGIQAKCSELTIETGANILIETGGDLNVENN